MVGDGSPQRHQDCKQTGCLMLCAIYTRVSTARQVDGFSLAEQRRVLVGIAEQRGWSWKLFSDPGNSGESLDRRPGMQSLLNELLEGNFYAVLTTDESRLARDELTHAFIRARLRDSNTRIVTLSGEIDLTDPSDAFFSGILGLAASLEQNLRRQKVTTGLHAAARSGYWPGGSTPWGLRTLPDGKHSRLAIHPDEADVLRRAVALIVDEHRSTWETAQILNAEQRRPRKAQAWTHITVRRQLLATHFCGVVTWNKRGRAYKAGEQIEIPAPCLLTKQQDRALKRALQATSTGPRRSSKPYPLAGRLISPCGSTYGGQFRKSRDERLYVCHCARIEAGDRRCHCPRLRADEIEGAVWAEVTRVLTPSNLKRMAAEHCDSVSDRSADASSELARLDAKIRADEEAVSHKVATYIRAGVDPVVMKTALEHIENDLEAMRTRRASLVALIGNITAVEDRVEEILKVADAARRGLSSMTLEMKARALELLRVRVIVTAPDAKGETSFVITGLVPEHFETDTAGQVELAAVNGQQGDLTLRRPALRPQPNGRVACAARRARALAPLPRRHLPHSRGALRGERRGDAPTGARRSPRS
jgi:DNA invertase Pin-like site-specific DNA recombinase